MTWDSMGPVRKIVCVVGRTQSCQESIVRGISFEQYFDKQLRSHVDYLVEATKYYTNMPVYRFSWGGDSGKLVVLKDGYKPLGITWGGLDWRTRHEEELIDHTFVTDINVITNTLDISLVT